MHPVTAEVTQRIVERSRETRAVSGSPPSTCSRASVSPESTRLDAELYAATDTDSGRFSTSTSPETAAIEPPSGSAPINRPRATTRRAASARSSAPEKWAAAISPTECPTSVGLVRPHDSSRR